MITKRRVQVGTDRRTAWFQSLLWQLLGFALTVLLLVAALEASDTETSWIRAAVTSLPAILLFAVTLRQLRNHLEAGELQRVRVRSLVLLGAIVSSTIGVFIFATALGGRNVRFVALCVVVLGASHLLSEFRNIETRRRGRALVLTLLALSLSIGGVYWTSSHPATGLLVAVSGAMFGYFAMVTASEHMVSHWDAPPGGNDDRNGLTERTGWKLLGTALIGASLWLFRSIGAGGWGIGTVIVLSVVVASVTSRGDFDLILVVVAVGLWWAVSPTTSAATTDLTPELLLVDEGMLADSQATRQPLPDREGVLLVFGDSYISGEGANRYVSGTNERGRNECRRSESTHHHLLTAAARHAAGESVDAELVAWLDDGASSADLARLANFPMRVLSVACSGAVAANIVDTAQFAHQPALPGGPTPARWLTQIQLADEYLSSTASYVDTIMVSIGGNDALFSSVVTTCLGPGDCSEIGQFFIEKLELLDPRPERGGDQRGERASAYDGSPTVLGAYQAIRDHQWQLGPDAEPPRVLVIPYPQPLADDSCIRMLTRQEHLFINDFVRQLNTKLRALAEEHGFEFVHTTETALLDNDRLCDNGDSWGTAQNKQGLNFLDFFPVGGDLTTRISPLSWVHNSVHPNKRGHELLAEAILRYDPKTSPVEPGSTLEQLCVNPKRWEVSDPPEERAESQTETGAAMPECFTPPTCRTVVVTPNTIEDPTTAEDDGEVSDQVLAEPTTREECTDPCDETLAERSSPRASRDDCPGTWVLGQVRNLTRVAYFPNLLAILGAWMFGTAVLGGPRDEDEEEENGNSDEDADVGDAGEPARRYPVAGVLIVVLILFGASFVSGVARTGLVYGAAIVVANLIFVGIPTMMPLRTGETFQPLVVRQQGRDDPFAGELRWWERTLREFRYQIIGWIGVVVFVAVVLFRSGDSVLGGFAAGALLATILGAALFPMVVSRPRRRSTQVALLTAVVLLAMASGVIWPWVIGSANAADSATVARDLPLLAGGLLALALLIGASIVDGAVREENLKSEGSFAWGIRKWLRDLSNKGASQLHSAQTLTGCGLLVAAIGAKQADGVEAYAIFGLVIAAVIVNWWALFLGQAGRLWPFATLSVLASIVAVELLWRGGWRDLGRIVMAVLAMYTVAKAFSAKTLRLTALSLVLLGAIGVYMVGTSVDADGGEEVPADFLDAMKEGLKGVWRSVFESLGVKDPPTPGPFVFASLLIGFVLIYRWMETVNSRRTLTPVTVEKFTSPADFADVEALTSQLQSELARAGITDPPFLPAGGLPKDVIAVFEGTKENIWASSAKALASLARPQRGTVVIPSVEKCTPDHTIVTIRVKDARLSRILYTASFHADEPRIAVRKAVAFVAGNTLGASATTPAWAKWESEDGLALRYFLESRSSSHYGVPIALDERVDKLRVAIAASPSTGLTRVDLGHVYELKQQPWRALRIHLEAAERHARLVAAHYRAATGLSMLAGDLLAGRTKKDEVDANTRRMVASALNTILKRHTNGDCDYFVADWLLDFDTEDPADRARVAYMFLEAADDVVSGVLRITSAPVLLMNAIVHQDERGHWVERLRNIESRRRDTGRHLVLREIIRVRHILAKAIALRDTANASDTEHAARAQTEIVNWHRMATTALEDAARIVQDYGGSGALYNYGCLLAVYVEALEANAAVFAPVWGLDRNSSGAAGARAKLEEKRVEAIETLYSARSHAGGGFPGLTWLRIDPDLSSLRSHPLFMQLTEWIEQGEEDIAKARDIRAHSGDERGTQSWVGPGWLCKGIDRGLQKLRVLTRRRD